MNSVSDRVRNRAPRASSSLRILRPAVDLAVVADPQRAIVAAHRLVGDRSRIDDRQSCVHEAVRCERAVVDSCAGGVEHRDVLRIGAALRERRHHPRAHVGADRASEMAGDAAHQRAPATRANTASMPSSIWSMPKLAWAYACAARPIRVAQRCVGHQALQRRRELRADRAAAPAIRFRHRARPRGSRRSASTPRAGRTRPPA